MELRLPITESDIVTFLGPIAVPERAEYLRFHLTRYRYLLRVVGQCLPRTEMAGTQATSRQGDARRILDIGTGFEVDLMRAAFRVPVDTAGFQHSAWPAREGELFYPLDLNDTEGLEGTVDRQYPVIVMAEVLEHVYTAPQVWLAKMRHWLAPGGFLIVQTPNAVFLPNRLKMLVGVHPFEKIRENVANPGHFREYTLPELRQIAHTAGFSVVSCSRKNYFTPANRLLRLLYRPDFLWPPSFRAGITLVLQQRE